MLKRMLETMFLVWGLGVLASIPWFFVSMFRFLRDEMKGNKNGR